MRILLPFASSHEIFKRARKIIVRVHFSCIVCITPPCMFDTERSIIVVYISCIEFIPCDQANPTFRRLRPFKINAGKQTFKLFPSRSMRFSPLVSRTYDSRICFTESSSKGIFGRLLTAGTDPDMEFGFVDWQSFNQHRRRIGFSVGSSGPSLIIGLGLRSGGEISSRRLTRSIRFPP